MRWLWVSAFVAGCAHRAPVMTPRGLGPSTSTAAALARALEPRHRAIVVGVDAYQDPAFPDLRHAVADADGIAERLGSRGGFEVVRVGPTRDEVFRALREAKTELRRDDVLVVYFSGHGTRVRDGERWRRFLLVEDSEPGDLDATAVDLDALRTFLSDLAPTRKALIVDACFNGDGKSVVRPELADLPEPSDALTGALASVGLGEAWLFATSAGRPSLEDDRLGHGVYTHYLLEALGWGFAEADRDGDGVVTAWEAHDHARAKVIAHTGGVQVPEAAFRVVGEADLVLGGEPAQRQRRERALVYLYADATHALTGATLTVDGRARGTLPGTVPLAPGRHHLTLEGPEAGVFAEGWTTVREGRNYRADELARLVRGVPGGLGVRAAAVASAPMAGILGAGAVGFEGFGYKRLTDGPVRGQYVGVRAGLADSPSRGATPNPRRLGWVGMEGGVQHDLRRLRWRLGWGVLGVLIPPDWYGERPTVPVDPRLRPGEAGWVFGATGPAGGLGYVASELWSVHLGLRTDAALLDVTGDGRARLVPWTTGTLGLEAAF